MLVRDLIRITSFKFNYFEIKNWDDSWLDSSYEKREILMEYGDRRVRNYTFKINSVSPKVTLIIQIEPY